MNAQSATALPASLRDRVIRRLGLARAPAPDAAGLAEVYRAWCRSVPFDNLRKMIALARGPAERLPGNDAVDFFEAWLDHGAGGTCWPTSNALLGLLESLGFEARRVAGAMRDLGFVNHGSVKVSLGQTDWLVDSSMLTEEPLPLGAEVVVQSGVPCAAEVEPVDGTHVVWAEFPPGPDPLPCRLLVDPADAGVHVSAYEASRERSPFNQRLYARRNREGEVLVLVGTTRHSRTARGLESRDCPADELLQSLRSEFGYSESLVREWVGAGALEASFAAPSGPKPPPMNGMAPSRRGAPVLR